MAKSDYICEVCNEVVAKKFISLSGFYKYACPKCGTMCEKHITKHLLGRPTCNKCGGKVLRYKFEDGRWTKA